VRSPTFLQRAICERVDGRTRGGRDIATWNGLCQIPHRHLRPLLPAETTDGILNNVVGATSDLDYFEDWEALRTMTPRWRRPPTSGNAGLSLVGAQKGWEDLGADLGPTLRQDTRSEHGTEVVL